MKTLTRTFSVPTLLGFLGLMIMVHSFASEASTPTIECKTAFGEKSFTIEEDHIAFNKEDQSGVSRSISSVSVDSIRTQKKLHGFTKTMYIDGNKTRINVENVDNFNDTNDFLCITSPKGHEMTYPLTCRSIQ
jgi:hypothetical protein